MNAEVKLNLLIDRAKVMRNYQRQYFLGHLSVDERRDVLIKARVAEQAFDSLIRAYIQETLPF